MAKKINRRDFLKIFGGATAGASSLLVACKNNPQQTTADQQEPPKDKMTMRVNPNTGDKVSLLGYGMMRLPVVGGGTELGEGNGYCPAPPSAEQVFRSHETIQFLARDQKSCCQY